MVRPKKTPISQRAATDKNSSLLNDNKKKPIDDSIKEKSLDLETDSDNNNHSSEPQQKKRNTKNSPSKKTTTLTKIVETNDKNSLHSSENENNESNKNKHTQKKQNEEKEQKIELDDSKSDTTKEKKTRKNASNNAKNQNKPAPPSNDNSLLDKEPRKRRLASLNAEFLVHYCSANTNVNISLSSIENKTCDINSNSSSKNDAKATNNNKRLRISSVESETNRKDKKVKNESEDEEEITETSKNNNHEINNKSKKKGVNGKTKSNNESTVETVKQKGKTLKKGKAGNPRQESEDEELEENSNASESELDSDDERDSEDDEECSEDDSVKRNKNYATHTTRKALKKTTTTTPRKSASKKNELETSKNSKRKQQQSKNDETENESAPDEEENISNDDEQNNKKQSKKLKTVRQSPYNKSKSRSKAKFDESTESEDESFISSNSKKKTRRKVKETVLLAETLTTGRPKREAGLRASAMIIQTNEIEKTRFQYYSSATASSTSLQTPQTNSNTTNKKKTSSTSSPNQADNLNSKKSKANEQLNKSHENFQVPQPISLYNSLTSGALSKTNYSNRKLSSKSRQNAVTSSQFTSSQVNQSSPINFNSRHIASLTASQQVNCQGGDDSSSNDVQILMETTSPQKNSKAGVQANSSSKTANVVVERTLTEDLLAEHNKLYGTLGCGGGGFNNYTRDYISKWALEYKLNDDKPFPPGQIPIETFGVKILNEPQYLQNKSRYGSNSNSTNSTNNTANNQAAVASTGVSNTAAQGVTANSSILKSKNQSNSTPQLKAAHGNEVTLNESSSKSNVLNEQASTSNHNSSSAKNILNNNQSSLTNNNNNNNSNNTNNNTSSNQQQHAQKSYSNTSNTSNEKLNSVNKKLNLASSKGITSTELNSNNNSNNKTNANLTNILNENSNNGISASNNNVNDSYSNNNNSSDNMNYFPRPMISSSSLNDILAASASSISLNKVISSNSAFNNLAAALNLNLTMPANSANNFQPANLAKKPFTPLVTAVAVAQSLQSFHQSKKIAASAPLHSTPNNSGNFFLNSMNSTSSILTQPVAADWQFNQAISKETQASSNDLLTSEAINSTKNLELWNKLKNSHSNLESLAKTNLAQSEESIKTLSLLSESIAKSNPNMMQAPINDQDYLRTKMKMDSKEQSSQDIINAPNMTMINVENLNFYTSIEGVHQQSHYLNHDLNCSGCIKTLNKNCYDHFRHPCNPVIEPSSHCMDLPAPQLPDQSSLASHLNYTQATAAATAAAVAMNIAKILTVNSRNLAQTKNNADDLNETKYVNNQVNSNMEVSNVNLKYPHKKQHFKSAENLESTNNNNNETSKGQANLDQLSSTIKIETTINETLKSECDKDLDSASTGKSDNSKSDARNSSLNDLKNKCKAKKTKKNSFIIQKDSNALSCSCRIKLEPDSMTITIDTNKDNFSSEKEHNCCSQKNIQHIDLKLSPGKINISKKNKSCEENQDDESDSESVASSNCSSSSGSIHLIVDEASTTNIEASDSNVSKIKIDSNESKLPSADTIEKPFSESVLVMPSDSKDDVSSPTSFFFNNKTSVDADTTTTKTPESKPKKWTISNSESDCQQITLVNSAEEVKLSIDDYVMYNSDKFVAKPKNEVKFTLYNDATNESSNTNYSIEDDDEEDDSKNNLKSEQENTFCYGQICSISMESKTETIMLKIRALLKPEQCQNSTEKSFEKNELVLSNYYFNDFDAEYLIKKCTILSKETYEKLKEEKLKTQENKKEEKSEKEDTNQDDLDSSKENSDALFYRYEYDYYKKCFISRE